jgi:hydroxypyruvate reductase
VLLSGGTTSLVGAPEDGITRAELGRIYSLLLGSGLEIRAMNVVRKRFSRWGGGKLARALAPATVRVFVVSDVIGDDLASIGSGPCAPDPTTAGEVRALLTDAGLWDRLSPSARTIVLDTEKGVHPETPKPGEAVFDRVTHEIIGSNRLALEAAGSRAAQLGLEPWISDELIAGEASAVGPRLARELLERSGGGGTCLIWGGETTVTLGEAPAGTGGRCQELALSASRILGQGPGQAALLAAGTDGRDGPTDAAGAIVDHTTWTTIASRGRDPGQALAQHDAYPALDVAGALLRPGLTGTNVMDVVIGICDPNRD